MPRLPHRSACRRSPARGDVFLLTEEAIAPLAEDSQQQSREQASQATPLERRPQSRSLAGLTLGLLASAVLAVVVSMDGGGGDEEAASPTASNQRVAIAGELAEAPPPRAVAKARLDDSGRKSRPRTDRGREHQDRSDDDGSSSPAPSAPAASPPAAATPSPIPSGGGSGSGEIFGFER